MQRKDARNGVNAAHRLIHLMDGCIGLSSFAATPGLSDVFPDFVGALRVYRTPAIGTLTNPSLRASVLRGMGAGSSLESGANEGGAGGGENNLAFKIKRKRVAIETLHLDTDGGVKERRTVPPKAEVPPPQPEAPRPDPTPSSPPKASSPTPPVPRLFAGLGDLRQRGLQMAQNKNASIDRQNLDF